MSSAHLPHRGLLRRTAWRRSQVLLHAAIVVVVVLSLAPIYVLLTGSVKNPLQYEYHRWGISVPLRLSNYAAELPVVQTYIVNTIVVAVLGCAGVLILSLIGGHVFARMRFPFREPLYYAIIALLMVPWVLSFVPAYMVYYNYGLINTYGALIVPNICGGQIIGIFLVRSFLGGIPEELYDAARIDGGGIWTLMMRISLPLSTPILAALAILNIVGQWNSFVWPLVAIDDESKQVISVGLYHLFSTNSGATAGLQSFDIYPPLFAGYVIASLPLVLLFIFLGRYYVEGLVSSGLKA